MITQEFHLSITSLGSDRYLIRTEDVAPDVPLAEVRVDWPVDDWIAQTIAWHKDPLTNLLSQEPAESPGQGETQLQLGRTLYNALFQGRLRDSWVAAQVLAQNRQKILRLRLGFKDSRLQRLPWELLYGDDRFITTGTDVTFARYYMGPSLGEALDQPPLPLGEPVRVLVIVSSPKDQERLDLLQEVRHLQQELLTASPRPADSTSAEITLDLEILEQPDRAALVNALEQGQFQMLHYAGHGELSETGGDLYLVSSKTGLGERLTGEDLAGLLVNNHIRLAVFNSCRGAFTQGDDDEVGWREQNLVQALVNRGVPGVIAMAERIPDNAALTFSQLLYRNLKRGYPIDLSLSRTRQGLITSYGSDHVQWTLPVLYMHPDFDGYLHGGADSQADLHGWLINGDEQILNEVLSQQAEAADLEEIEELRAFLREEEDIASAAVATPPASPTQPPLATVPEEPTGGEPAPAKANIPAPIADTSAVAPSPDRPAPPKFPIPRIWLLIGTGVLGTLALLLAVVVGNLEPEPAPPLSTEAPTDEPAIADRPVVVSAIAALNQQDTETVLDLGETLLDQGDLQAVESILAQASPTQLESDPKVAYLRGRWQWQGIGQGTASVEDAHRAWLDSVEADPDFVPAQVALGFAQYALGRDWDAVETWETAINKDYQHQTDLDSGPQVANAITVQAYAGLAMAYSHLSQISVQPPEKERHRLIGQEYFDQAIALEPRLLQPYRQHWLWDPVADDWPETIDYLSLQ